MKAKTRTNQPVVDLEGDVKEVVESASSGTIDKVLGLNASGKLVKGEVIKNTILFMRKSIHIGNHNVNLNYEPLDNEDISFWYDTYKETKPLGTKCIMNIKRGFFGLRYADNVDFLVE